MVSAAATGAFSKPAVVNVTGVEDNKAIQQSIVRLSEEIASLAARTCGCGVLYPKREGQITIVSEQGKEAVVAVMGP